MSARISLQFQAPSLVQSIWKWRPLSLRPIASYSVGQRVNLGEMMPEDPALVFYESSRILLERRITSVDHRDALASNQSKTESIWPNACLRIADRFYTYMGSCLAYGGEVRGPSDHPANRTERGTCRHKQSRSRKKRCEFDPPPTSIVAQIFFFSKTLW